MRLGRFLFIFQIHSRLFSSPKDHAPWERNESLSHAGKELGSERVIPIQAFIYVLSFTFINNETGFGAECAPKHETIAQWLDKF